MVCRIIDMLNSSKLMPDTKRAYLLGKHLWGVLGEMMEQNITYGEVTGGPGTAMSKDIANEQEFKARLRLIDNDLAEQARIVLEGVENYFKCGEMPAPYYAWRIGVILRKAKAYSLEADFLEAFSSHFRHGNGSRYRQIAKRANKARALAEKHNSNR